MKRVGKKALLSYYFTIHAMATQARQEESTLCLFRPSVERERGSYKRGENPGFDAT